MAAPQQIETTDPNKSAMDYSEHEKTYALFTNLAKWITVACVIVLILMAIFLA